MQIKYLLNTGCAKVDDNGIYLGYHNDIHGRSALVSDCPSDIVAEVMAVWGDTPTVPDEPPWDEPPYAPHTDPRDLAIAQLMRDVAEIKGGTAHV